MSGIASAPARTRRARPLIHGSSSSTSRASAASRSRTSIASSSRRRTRARGSSRSPMESRASIACARTSTSSEWRQRRITPPASGTPSTTRARRASPIVRASRRERTASRNASAGSGGGPPGSESANIARARRSSVARSSRPSVQAMTASSDIRAVTTERDQRRLLRPVRAAGQHVQQAQRGRFAVRQCLGRRGTDLGDVVVECANQLDVDLGAVHAVPRRQRRQGGSADRS